MIELNRSFLSGPLVVFSVILISVLPITISLLFLGLIAFFSVDRKDSGALFISLLFLQALVAALLSNSYPITSDIESYREYYNQIVDLTFGIEIIYPTLVSIARGGDIPFNVFTFLVSMVGYCIIFFIVYKMFGRSYFAVIAILLISVFPILIYRQVFLIRQYIGAIFFFLCLVSLWQNKRQLSLIFMVLSVLSHFSYVIFAWIYIQRIVNLLSHRRVSTILLLAAVLFPFSIDDILSFLSFVGFDLPYVIARKISYYSGEVLAASVSVFKPMYIFSLLPLLMFLCLDEGSRAERGNKILGAITLFSCILLMFFRDVSILSGRLAFFLSIFSPLIACIFINQYKIHNRQIVVSGYTLLVVVYFVAWVNQNDLGLTSLVLADGDLAGFSVSEGLMNLTR